MGKTVLATVTALCLCSAVYARDGWQGRPAVCDPENIPAARVPLCQNWISNVKRPDKREASCCGEGDAFIADDFELAANGDFYAVITGDYTAAAPTYDDEGKVIPPDGRQSVYRGMRIRVPQEKLNHAQQDGGNPSGHGVIFLDWTGSVLCYFGGTLF